MRKKLLTPYFKYPGGRYYNHVAIQKIILEFERIIEKHGSFYGSFKNSDDYCSYGDSSDLIIQDISFEVTNLIFSDGGSLDARIKLLETPRGKELESVIDLATFIPCVWGFIEEDGKVKVERLISINAYIKNDFPDNKF